MLWCGPALPYTECTMLIKHGGVQVFMRDNIFQGPNGLLMRLTPDMRQLMGRGGRERTAAGVDEALGLVALVQDDEAVAVLAPGLLVRVAATP